MPLMKKKLVVYLLSYKRPEYICEAVESILAQTYQNFDLIISENSPDDIVYHLIQKYLSNNSHVQIIKRTPSLLGLDHFNLILKECQTYEYAMLFHDDDILMPEALSAMMTEIEKDKKIIAVGCNAYLLNLDLKTTDLFNKNSLTHVSKSFDLINAYTIKRNGHPPFPSYIYRTQYISKYQLNKKNGGKHSDVSFLVDLITEGPMIWISKPLMYYRKHDKNDSASRSLHDVSHLSVFFLKKSPLTFFSVFIYFIKNLIQFLILKIKTLFLKI